MLHVRVWQAIVGLVFLASASCSEGASDASSGRAGARAAPTRSSAADSLDGAGPAAAADFGVVAADQAAPAFAKDGLAQKRLPGASARTVLIDQLNEGENVFFTEDGRLFVSGAEDIFEIKRAPDGTFTKTDHFDEDCIVEGIVRSGNYLYGVCWRLADLSGRAFLIAGEITETPVFRTIAELETGSVPNGMTVDAEGHIYVTYSTRDEVVRLTLAAPMQLDRADVWASDLQGVNGIKNLNGFNYVTLLNDTLVSEFARIPVLPDGSAGKPEQLYQRALTVLDDVLPFEGGFIITDFLKGTLIFWDQQRGVYAETPAIFYGPTSLAQGRPPMFSERQLIVPEKGDFLIRDQSPFGDLLSMYQLP